MKRALSGWVYADDSFDPGLREKGRDWPENGQTMIGLERLDNIQFCVEDVLSNGVPGDLIETGVWRGGATIFMRAILKAHGVEDRRVWVADSFEGLPPPDLERYPQDKGDQHHTFDQRAVSAEQVRANFERYGLLDDQVRFLEGFFRDTLPEAPMERLAVVRLDGDMYESTMDALVNLYPKLSVRGYLIVDDYGAIPTCRQAVHDYREAHDVHEELRPIDWTGVFWQRSSNDVILRPLEVEERGPRPIHKVAGAPPLPPQDLRFLGEDDAVRSRTPHDEQASTAQSKGDASESAEAPSSVATGRADRSPREPGGIKRVQVGCGPHHIMEDWWNVDLRAFPGIDEAIDATEPWPYQDLDYVLGEHFLEHLSLDGALAFLEHAGNALRPGGKLRLSTPNLEWVLATHYPSDRAEADERIAATLTMNRAFHGWGHQFLYSRSMLEYLLTALGFAEVSFFSYGESDDPNLRNLERHGGFSIHEGHPSVVIAEATRGSGSVSAPAHLVSRLEEDFLRYVAAGH